MSHITSKQLRALKLGKHTYATETELVKACIHWLTANGVACWRNNTGAAMLPGKGGKLRPVRFGKKGSADILGIAPGGRFCAIECKQPGENLRPDQAVFMELIRSAGGIAIVAHDTDELAAAYLAEAA